MAWRSVLTLFLVARGEIEPSTQKFSNTVSIENGIYIVGKAKFFELVKATLLGPEMDQKAKSPTLWIGLFACISW
jgi:hypothetical protein